MLAEGMESNQLWEAFAKYGRIPPPYGWGILCERLLSTIVEGKLSPEALRRLTDMAVIVWSWTRQADTKYRLLSTSLRSMLSLTSDQMRAEAASQLQGFFSDREEGRSGNPWD